MLCYSVPRPASQVCLLDLDYNLPVQVRDTALGVANDDEPASDVGKEYALTQVRSWLVGTYARMAIAFAPSRAHGCCPQRVGYEGL
jgi:hypothetical protein